VPRRAALTRTLRPEARKQHALAAPLGGDQLMFAITRRAISYIAHAIVSAAIDALCLSSGARPTRSNSASLSDCGRIFPRRRD
jgi:hypothetical protein